MSLKPSRRSLNVVPKVKLGDLCPLPEPVEEMAVEVEETPMSVNKDSLLDAHVALTMMSALHLDGAASGNSTPSLLGEGSFDDVFAFDSADDDDDQGRSWQLSGDTGSSDFGNSVTSFMSWNDDVEVDTTRKVQDLFDELEKCFYGEESLGKLKKEAAAECSDWRSKFPHFRVRGAGIESGSLYPQRPYGKECMDGKVATDETALVVLDNEGDSGEEEEVIASHGSCQEQLELNECCNRNDNSRPNIAQNNILMCCNKNRSLSAKSLRQKVKDSVMEQLFAYVWSEVSKSLEPLVHSYSESTFQQIPGHLASIQGQSRMDSPGSSAVGTPFAPISDVCGTELEQCMSAKSIQGSGKRTFICPVLHPNLNGDKSVLSQLERRTGLTVDPALQLREPPINSLPKPLSLHSANRSLVPMPTLEFRGYHSAADGRTRPVLTRRFNSMTSRHKRFLKPLEEQQTVAANVTSALRQVSAPTSPPNWSRHVTLPPIDHLDPHMKGLSLQCEPRFKSSGVRPRSRTSAKQKLQGLHSACKSKIRSHEGSSRSHVSVKQKVPFLPVDLSGPVSIQGTGLSKTDCAKRMLDMQEDLSFEEKNGVISNGKDRRGRWKLRGRTHVN